MPNFKPKANKKFKMNKKMDATLDSKHHEKMCEFANIKNKIIPDLKKKRELLLKEKEQRTTIEEILNIEDKIKDI